MKKKLTISVVIPVYNEVAVIGKCLDSLLRQTIPPHEIIIVNNNSTDDTVAFVAAAYPQVTILHEPRQGIVFARTRGFDAANGDIIARLDADTRLPAGWMEQTQEIFRGTSVAAVVGQDWYYDKPLRDLVKKADKLVRRVYVWGVRGQVLHGCNMAIRRMAWREVRRELCTSRDIHEDSDLAIHLYKHRLAIMYAPSLLAAVSARRFSTRLPTFCRYLKRMVSTYARHSWRDVPGVWFLCVMMLGGYVINAMYELVRVGWNSSWSRSVYYPME